MHLVDAVVVVAREDEREVELLARPVVLRHVEVAQRDDEVDPVLRLQLRLVGAHGRVRALDARAAKGVAPVHGGVVGEDADEAHPAATRRRSQLDNVAGDHVPRLEGVVRLHICVYPYSIVLGCALVGAGLANVVPALFSESAALASTPQRGIAAAATAGYTGLLIGPPFVGALASLSTLRLSMAALALIALLAASLALSRRR